MPSFTPINASGQASDGQQHPSSFQNESTSQNIGTFSPSTPRPYHVWGSKSSIGIAGATYQEFYDVSAVKMPEALAQHYNITATSVGSALSRAIGLKAEAEGRDRAEVKLEHNQLRLRNGVIKRIDGKNMARVRKDGGHEGKSWKAAPAPSVPALSGPMAAPVSIATESATADNTSLIVDSNSIAGTNASKEWHGKSTPNPHQL